MIEGARSVTDWLQHATYGVNAKLALVPRDPDDPAPPSLALIADETRHLHAALGLMPDPKQPDQYPCLLVAEDGTEISNADPQELGESRVTLLIRYGQRTVEPAKGLQASCYTLRAVLMSLRELHLPDHEAARTRNEIQLVVCEQMSLTPLFQEADDAWVTGAVRVTYLVRDNIPRG